MYFLRLSPVIQDLTGNVTIGIMHDNTTRVISLQKIRVEQHIQSRLTDHHLHRHTHTLVMQWGGGLLQKLTVI
jgi:hypothetical protein